MVKAHGHIVSVLLTKKQYQAMKKQARVEGRGISSYIRHVTVLDLIKNGHDVVELEDDETGDDDSPDE